MKKKKFTRSTVDPRDVKKFEWRGQPWKLFRLDDGVADKYLGRNVNGTVDAENFAVFVRKSVPKPAQVLIIFHEFAHEMFPEWKVEPDESSRSELGIFERDLPALLVALGVDLSPLVDW